MITKENNHQEMETKEYKIEKNKTELTKKQLVFYIVILGVTISIFVLSMIGINPFFLLIIIGIVIVYVYLDKDIQEDNQKES
jgi:uncharacterized membrane protein YdbT with pleckstrin-like domain